MRLVITCLFRAVVLFEISITVAPEQLERSEHLMLNKSIHCLIIEIKHEKGLHITKHHTLA